MVPASCVCVVAHQSTDRCLEDASPTTLASVAQRRPRTLPGAPTPKAGVLALCGGFLFLVGMIGRGSAIGCARGVHPARVGFVRCVGAMRVSRRGAVPVRVLKTPRGSRCARKQNSEGDIYFYAPILF